MTETPATAMDDTDIEIIATLSGIPAEKVRCIVWLAERHMAEITDRQAAPAKEIT